MVTGELSHLRLRLLAVLCFLIVVVSVRHPLYVALLTAGVLLLYLAGRRGLRPLLLRLGPVFLGSALFFVLVLVSHPGEAAWQVGAVGLSRSGLATAGLISLRLLAAATAVAWLSATLGERNLFAALWGLGLPPLLIYQLLFTWRFLHVLAEDVWALHRAAGARAYVPGRFLWDRATFGTLGRLLGALLLRSLSRSERVSLAVACRGLNGHPPLVVANPGWRWRDLPAGLSLAAAAAVLIWLDRGGLWPMLLSWR